MGRDNLTPGKQLGNRRQSFFLNAFPDPKVLEQEEIPWTLDSLIGVLRLPSKERTQKHIEFVLTYTRDASFFQKFAKEEGEHALKQCILMLNYEFFCPGQFVFRQGDLADRFYIILEGTCGVLVTSERGTQEVRTYARGESFGELALLQNQPRAASIQCKSLCHFAVLRKDDFERTVQRLQSKKLEEKVDFLLSQPMFKCWTKRAMTRLSYYFFERSFSRKQVVYKAGDPSNELYLIRDGEFRLLKEITVDAQSSPIVNKHKLLSFHEKTTEKKQFEIASLTRGEVFGVEELFDSVPRTCTCVCYTGEAEAYVISRDDFFKRVKNEEKLAQVRNLISTRDHLRTQRLENRKNLSTLLSSCSVTIKREADCQTPRVKTASSFGTERFTGLLMQIPTVNKEGEKSPRKENVGMRRVATWDEILTHTFQPVVRRKTKLTDGIVNIHTQGRRLEQAERELEVLRVHLVNDMPTPRSAVSTPYIRSSHFTPRMPQLDTDSTPRQRKSEWRLLKSSHSLFRPMRTTRF